ncbi:MAG: hypothetical protein IJ748_00625, partial [Bacteroidales bacterium]|nr:hypothetical protein [Bacteroidales bacterium]
KNIKNIKKNNKYISRSNLSLDKFTPTLLERGCERDNFKFLEKENNSSSADNEFLKKNAEILEYGIDNPNIEPVSSNAAEHLSVEAEKSKMPCCENSSKELYLFYSALLC